MIKLSIQCLYQKFNSLTARFLCVAVASRKSHGNHFKENEDPEFDKKTYQPVFMARNSLKQKEEKGREVQVDSQRLNVLTEPC
jgi:hypothetical protein